MIDYNELENLLNTGYDIEFSYKGKEYSIVKTNRNTISFCEFYREPIDFETINDFMNNAMIDGNKLSDIWESVTDLFY
ncbi:MAG: hypothetical protein ACI4IR_06265 [Eubacterium sp.]